MKKTYIVNDIIWIFFAFLVCLGGWNLGFGTFQQPYSGFLPFLAGIFLGLLALMDLIFGLMHRWKTEKGDNEIWAAINWKKFILVIVGLFIYVALFNTLGFVIETFLLLLFFFRLVEPKSLWTVLFASAVTTGLFYLIFQIGLGCQLPRSFLGL